MSSLAEKFASLADTTPVLQDPEDDINIETRARVIDDYDEEDDDVIESSSNLRQKNIQLLSDVDEKYKGKKISRASLSFDFDADGGSESSFESNGEKEQKSDEETSDVEEEENSDEEEIENSDEGDIASESTGCDVIRNFSKIDISKELAKGKAVQAQLGLWDKLLEIRIKLQKMLVIANKLPQYDVWNLFKDEGGEDLNDNLKTGGKFMKRMFKRLVEMQEDILSRNPETEHIINPDLQTKKKKMDDEEIQSDTDQEQDQMEEDQPATRNKLKRNLTPKEYPGILAKRHKSFSTYRNDTIQRWNERTRIASGKLNQKSFAAFEQSALTQIEQILSDKSRLCKRTQLKRNAYRVLGKADTAQESDVENNESNKTDDNLKDYDAEIFDDNDFYHQLLRELIERKTADVNDPVALSRQWLEIQKLRGKTKRKVDTKASKGRKIRFDVLPKLVNFMAPVDNGQFTEEARNELFNSLFGQRNYSVS